jgi:hypothetical protein
MAWLVIEESTGAFGSFNLDHVENVSSDGSTWFVHVVGNPPKGFRNPLHIDFTDLPALDPPTKAKASVRLAKRGA